MQVLTAEGLEKRISDSYELSNNVLKAVSEPMVTVCTLAYQHGPYIRECIEGVLTQKMNFPFEFIIGEDFSTDGTREIVFEYAKKYPDIIRVITADRNTGMKANWMRCSRAVRGKYRAVCEGDDYWTDPNKLQSQVDILEANPEYSLCFHNAKVVYMDSGRASHPFAEYDREIYTIEDVICKRWFVPTQSFLLRNSLMPETDWTKYIFNEDYAAQLLLADKGPFYCINREMSVYRKHGTSLSAVIGIHRSTFNRIQNLHYFDMYTNFKYHETIARKEVELIKPLYQTFLYQRPRWARLLSVDYYSFRIAALCRVAREGLQRDGLKSLRNITREIWSRRRR